MKYKQLLLLITISSSIIASSYHNQLIIPSVNSANPSWEFVGNPIHQKEDGLFTQLVEKWNDILGLQWNKVRTKIKDDIHISTAQIDYYMTKQHFINAYMNFYKNNYPEIFDETYNLDIDENVLNFILLTLNYLQVDTTNIKIYPKEDTYLLTSSFGAHKDTHYLVFHAHMFNAENINSIYNSHIQNKPNFYIAPHTNLHKSRSIEYNNFLHLGIAQSVSNIVHQGDFFAKLLRIFTYNNKTLSQETQIYGSHYVQFRSYLEACLQSKNPLEAAIFLEPQVDNLHQDFLLLWQDFIQDIQSCYNEDDLQAYENLSLQARRSILFNHHDDEN